MTVDLRPADLTRGDVVTDPGQPSRLCTVDHVIIDGTRALVGTISGHQHAMGARVPVRVWNRYEAHGLTVNEAGVLATRTGAQWWSDFLLAHRDTGRVQTLWASLGGAVCFVACDTRSDAAWLHQHAQDRGIPARFLTITTRTHRVEPDDFIGLAEGPIIVGVDDEHPEARSA